MHEYPDIPSFTEILSWWPSDQSLADDMGVPNKMRVRQWRERNSVRPKYWPALIQKVAERFGRVLTSDQLMRASAGEHRPVPERSRTEGNGAEAA